MPKFYEFFAGAGMVRAGLGNTWTCAFANDFDLKKCRTYAQNWGAGSIKCNDIRALSSLDIPGRADLAWASFPCQDLSLAGGGAGLRGDRSGTFWPFWDLMHALVDEGRPPAVIALENVCGTLTSHKGKDFTAISRTFREAGYRFGAVVIDAALFVPQSRPRLFMIGVHKAVPVPDAILADGPDRAWHTKALVSAYDRLGRSDQRNWLWWRLPLPQERTTRFADVIEDQPAGGAWHSAEETNRLIAMMSPVNRLKLEAAIESGRRMVGAVYKRTRRDEDGRKVQRAEIRFDDISGCLRTPAGGSSRQLIVVVDGRTVKSRLISTREAARLMGLPDSYELPSNYNEAYHLAGDGVAVDAVRYLKENIFDPIISAKTGETDRQAA